jgi:hypothetical protein
MALSKDALEMKNPRRTLALAGGATHIVSLGVAREPRSILAFSA